MFQSFIFGTTRSWSSRFRYSSHLLKNLTGKDGLFEQNQNLLGDTMTPNWETFTKMMILSQIISDSSPGKSMIRRLFPDFEKKFQDYPLRPEARKGFYNSTETADSESALYGNPLEMIYKFLQV